jgi:hypothetical protein
MTDANDTPLAIWYWKTDQGKWCAYSDALCSSLEDAWATKATRFPVDGERFVDTVKMLQKRLDLTGKAREVKRESHLALVTQTIAVVGKLKLDVGPMISKHGGIVTPYITSKVCSLFYLLSASFLAEKRLTSSKSQGYSRFM